MRKRKQRLFLACAAGFESGPAAPTVTTAAFGLQFGFAVWFHGIIPIQHLFSPIQRSATAYGPRRRN
jgi:hypothetical protein